MPNFKLDEAEAILETLIERATKGEQIVLINANNEAIAEIIPVDNRIESDATRCADFLYDPETGLPN